jgi:hypothetical protein
LALRVPLPPEPGDDGGNVPVMGLVLLGRLKFANIGTFHILLVMVLQSR